VNGYHIQSKIGKGSYGKIYKVTRDGLTLALKRVDMTNLMAQEQTDTLNEVSLMAQLDNEHIVRFYDAFMENNSMYIAMELLSGGDLGNIIHKAQKANTLIDEEVVWPLLVESCCGLKYLHDRRMLHRDLKPQNIMLDSQGHVKLVDFGFTKLLAANQLAMSVVGTPLYMSPELLRKQGYDDRTDVWSLGCIFYELLTLSPPFGGRSWEDLSYNILNKVPPSPSTEKYSSDLITVINRMMIKDARQRPSLREIMKMPEFASHFLKYKKVDPFEEDEVEIWHELTTGISPQITGTRIMAAQFTWFVKKLAESRRQCKGLQEELERANATIAELKDALAASSSRESIGEDLGDSKDAFRPKKLVFRKEVEGDSDDEDSSASSSDSEGAEKVTAMMNTMQLNTPQTHPQPRATDKRLTSLAASQMTSTPMKAPMTGGKTSHSKLIQFPADHFGLVPMLPPDSSVSALFAWQKQDKPVDKRISYSPVWGNKDVAKLLIPNAHILIFVRTPSASTTGSSRRLFLKTIYVGYAGEESMRRADISPDETRPLPVVGQQPDRSVWYYIPFQGKSEIGDLRLEFESANLANEVVIVRANKLLDVISRKEKDLSASPARNALAPPVSTQAKSSTSKASSQEKGEEILTLDALSKMQEEFMQTSKLMEETAKGYK